MQLTYLPFLCRPNGNFLQPILGNFHCTLVSRLSSNPLDDITSPPNTMKCNHNAHPTISLLPPPSPNIFALHKLKRESKKLQYERMGWKSQLCGKHRQSVKPVIKYRPRKLDLFKSFVMKITQPLQGASYSHAPLMGVKGTEYILV